MILRKPTLLLWASLALYVVAIATAYALCKNNWLAIQTLTVVLTGVVIIWYTWETRQLREVAVAQRELQLRPFVVVELQKDKFVVSNVGSGVAVNVRVNEVLVDKEHEILVRFPKGIAILRPDQTLPIHAESFKKGKPADDFFLVLLNPEFTNREIEVRVEFQDAEMKPYSLSERVLPNQLQIKGFSQMAQGIVTNDSLAE